jgi:hypothetical protein
VEGGSANDYDYCSGDPVNCNDLSGAKQSRFRFHQAVWCFTHSDICAGAYVLKNRAEKAGADLLKYENVGANAEDAFLHAYWMALTTYYFGEDAARSLGNARSGRGRWRSRH